MGSDESQRREQLELPADDHDRIARVRRAAIRIDTGSGLLAAARGLRRRLPGDEKFGDPLSTAGDAPVS